ncbi:hypothetical protein V6N13_065151 [Hibiscus sabdariffa]|uniref:Uncharacterized protein n=1 Tax=Hibiscus sabdariffa TaxID=183260 RepID=A0ABR2QRS0_9ROSI
MKGTSTENVEMSQHALSQEQDITVNRWKVDEVEVRVVEVDKWQYGELAQNTVDLNIFQKTGKPPSDGLSQQAWNDLCDMGLGPQNKAPAEVMQPPVVAENKMYVLYRFSSCQ